MNRKLILLLIPIIVLLACSVGALIIISEEPAEQLYTENIKMADKYLESNNIEKAVLYYKKAIENDKTQEEPYLSLAVIYYQHQNNIEKAISILEEGSKNTNSDNIKDALQKYLDIKDNLQSNIDVNNSANDNNKEVINRDMLNMFTNDNYGKYLTNYSIITQNYSNKIYTVRYSGINAEFVYYNTDENKNILNEATGKPNNEATPCEIKVDNINDIINNASEGVTYDEMKKSGVYNLIKSFDSSENKNILTFSYNGCTMSVECDENGNIKGSNLFNKLEPIQKAPSEVNVNLSGKVIHKGSPRNVQNANLVFRKGTDVKSGSVYKECAATDGTYSTELEASEYTVEVSAANYETTYYNIELKKEETSVTQDFEISPKNTGEGIKVVVEWTGDTQVTSHSWCRDNSHIIGEIGHYEGYDGDVLYDEGGNLVADYKRGTSSETTTFYPVENRDYEVHVHGDYYDDGVIVKIYLPGESTPTVIANPTSTVFGYWVVCDINNGTINNINGTVS